MQTIAETNYQLHILVKFKPLVVLQPFYHRPLIHELFLKVVIAKGIQKKNFLFVKIFRKEVN